MQEDITRTEHESAHEWVAGLEIMLLEGRYSIACSSSVSLVIVIRMCCPLRHALVSQRHLDGECGIIKICAW